MADKLTGYESENTDKVDSSAGAGGHSGSDVKQGLRGSGTRAQARGRDEFRGHGDQADLDEGRTEIAGRHYGRSGPEEPGPGYGRGALQPDEGTVARPENDGVDYDEIKRPQATGSPNRSGGDHEPVFAQGRDAGARKQMLPSDGRGTAPPEPKSRKDKDGGSRK